MPDSNAEQPSVGDLLNKPEMAEFAIVDDEDAKAKAKPKGKGKARRIWLPGHMVMNTRLIVGLVAVTALAVGLSIYTLTRSAQIEVFVVPPTLPTIPLQIEIIESPTARFAQPDIDLANQIVVLREPLYGYPAGTQARVGSTWIENFGERFYSLTLEDGTGLTNVPESMLMLMPNIITPDSMSPKYSHLLGLDVYSLFTINQIGDILPGTMVRVNTARLENGEWVYEAALEGSNLWFNVKESELDALLPTPIPPE